MAARIIRAHLLVNSEVTESTKLAVVIDDDDLVPLPEGVLSVVQPELLIKFCLLAYADEEYMSSLLL